MQKLYDNNNFTIQQNEHGGLWVTNNRTGYTTSATVYDNNTVGYDWPSVMTKASRRAIDAIVRKQTGKPALMRVSLLGEYKTYGEYYGL